jgi:hypothetical protein
VAKSVHLGLYIVFFGGTILIVTTAFYLEPEQHRYVYGSVFAVWMMWFLVDEIRLFIWPLKFLDLSPEQPPGAHIDATPEELAKIMADKPEVRLRSMFARPENWSPEELDAARAELKRRNNGPNNDNP